MDFLCQFQVDTAFKPSAILNPVKMGVFVEFHPLRISIELRSWEFVGSSKSVARHPPDLRDPVFYATVPQVQCDPNT